MHPFAIKLASSYKLYSSRDMNRMMMVSLGIPNITYYAAIYHPAQFNSIFICTMLPFSHSFFCGLGFVSILFNCLELTCNLLSKLAPSSQCRSVPPGVEDVLFSAISDGGPKTKTSPVAAFAISTRDDSFLNYRIPLYLRHASAETWRQLLLTDNPESKES